MKENKIIIFLLMLPLFLICDNVDAAECKYNDGGIPCCKKASLEDLKNGDIVSKIPIKEKDANKCGSSFSDCGRNDYQDTKMGGNTQNAKKVCDDKNGRTIGNGTIQLNGCRLSSKQGYHFCRCVKHYLVVNTCVTRYECPKGTIDDGKGKCKKVSNEKTYKCVEWEGDTGSIEDRVEIEPDICPSDINWGGSGSGKCYSELSYYSDSTDWKNCIYKDNSKKEENYGNSDFCPVYCIETFTANTMNQTPIVKAGNNFTFPDKSNYLFGTRTCKAQYIDWDKFLSQLEAANKKVITTYIEWQRELTKEKIISGFSATGKCDSYCPGSGQYVCSEDGCCKDVWKTVTCWNYNKNGIKIPGSSYECREKYSEYVGPVSYRGKYYTYNGRDSKEDSFIVDNKNYKVTVGGWCDTTDVIPTADTTTAENNYRRALQDVKAIYNKMVSCYDWGNLLEKENLDKFYNVDPKVSLTYKGANGNTYTYDGQLNVSTEKILDYDIAECTQKTVKLAVGFDKNNNTLYQTRNVKHCTRREAQVNAYSELELSSDVYRYVNKANGQSFHANQLKSFGNSKYFNYIDMGYGNLPVGFATKPGVYGYSTGLGELSLTYYNIGHISDKNSSETRIEKIINKKASEDGKSNYNKIYCDYKVTNGLVPSNPTDPNDSTGGITLIYRPIDLYEPFPNIDGEGRNTGANWCDSNNCSNTNNVVKKYILNNRNVVGDEVYNLEPMYSFKLTPAIINSIREYNKNNAYDYDSTGMKTGMVCDKGKGTRCISEYLTKLIEMTEATGTCTQNRKDTFDTCRY